MTKILVYAELFNSKPVNVGLELTSKAAELSFGNVVTLIIGKPENGVCEKFSKAGADKIIVLNEDMFDDYCVKTYSDAVLEINKLENPDIILFGATVKGREIASFTATALETGLTADCTGLEINDGILEATRPAFGGNLYATIICKTSPQCATVREGVFKRKTFEKQTNIVYKNLFLNSVKNSRVLNFIPKALSSVDISKEKILISGGAGMKNKEGFEKLKGLASLAGGRVCGTRVAAEKGLISADLKVGQTGKTVNADIYLAFGISGAVQHCAGIFGCGKIFAVNNDENAPIFQISDAGFVGDAAEIADKLADKLKKP